MKQTSQAIALLLTTTNAADALIPSVTTNQAAGYQGATTVFSPDYVTPTQSMQMQGRTSQYVNQNPTTAAWLWTAATFQGSKVASNAAYSTAVNIAGSGCMQCINGLGVWCSRTFSFMINDAASPQTYQYESTTAANTFNLQIPSTDALTQYGTFDQGSCCNTQVIFTTYTGYLGVAVAAQQDIPLVTSANLAASSPVLNVETACVANSNAEVDGAGPETTKFGQGSWNVISTKYTSWWCSNGLYKKVIADDTTSTSGVVNVTQGFLKSSNQRRELAQVACPNKTSVCGITQTATASGYTLLTSGSNTATYEIINTAGPAITDKCTWVAGSYVSAPVFKVESGGTGVTALGLTSDNYQIHTMEYGQTSVAFAANTGVLSSDTGAAASGFIKLGTALNSGNFIPRFDMEAAQFSTLRTWYGYTTTVGEQTNSGNTPYQAQPSNWFTSGQNGFSNSAANALLSVNLNQQFYGNVSNIGTSTMYTGTTAAPAGQNFGSLNSQKFDFRSVRYIPASVVQSSYKTGSDLATLYKSKVTTYNTAKTVWNNYVAILSKNAKMDAFAAAFSPPKAPTVPPLPNMPWSPASYTGFYKQTTQAARRLASNTGVYDSAAQPNANEFWTSLDAAQSIGGWGSFTAQIMTYRAGFGKSFGTIGFGTDFTMSQVWNNDWMCASVSDQTDITACAMNFNVAGSGGTQANVPTNTVTATPINTVVQLITVVSLWSTGMTNAPDSGAALTAAGWSLSSFKLTFTGTAWSNTLPALTAAISNGSAPSAADSLSGIAGAQALAASSAAVLALAALY